MTRRTVLTFVLATGGLSVHAMAAVVQQVGADLNIGEGIRSTSVPKLWNLDPSIEAYGVDGNEFFGVTSTGNTGGALSGDFEANASINLPSYIADIAGVEGGLNQSARDFGYSQIDDPSAPIANVVDNVDSGLAFRSGTANGVEYPLFDIVLADTDIPELIRVGLYTDNEGADQRPLSFRIALVDDPSVDSGAQAVTGTANAQLDGYFFDIFFASPGDVYRVYAVSRATIGNVTIVGVTFDSVDIPSIPEPAALAPLAVFGLLLRRSRRLRLA
jgi:hypothetical protein